MSARVLVTGAGGYLGGAVVRALAGAGHEPVALVRPGAPDVPGARETRAADLLDTDALRRAVSGVEAVCHLAGLARARESFDEPLRYFRVNTGGTIGLLEAMADAGVRGLVFSSTCAVYGSPDRQPMTEDLPVAPPHPYASSKVAAEAVVEAQASSGALGAIVLRLPNLAGGEDRDPTRLIPRVLDAARSRTPLGVNGDGSAVRDYLHVDDAAAGFVAAVEQLPAPGGFARYNLGSGRGTSILDVVAAVERATGRRVPLVHNPPAHEPQVLIADAARAIAELGWRPTRSEIDTIIASLG
ncbi:NAD-dependent epimerase/dehydratase family protein [Nocardia sp. CDC153]|uniref:NAD-dependent epimerase/dehydratase family protein n=1 Tax=Nocardia sp. CDC153 TaxID=3112167 RepID=UPI002DB9293C|nr:NAD-dependent epimerase/dehydratase family protein [Nocardia sp. CDC153]MEC3955760.1 NAD-dependent epimerase/dehydratase family protein [Nocardia sp. CDC153]